MPRVPYRSEQASDLLRALIAEYTKEHTMKQLAAELGISYNTLFVWQQKGVPLPRAEQVREMYMVWCEKNVTDRSLVCIYNFGVNCLDEPRRCEKCGWRPEVARKRLEDFRSGIKKKAY